MTDQRESGLIREALYSGTGTLREAGLVREVLRSTGTGGATRMQVSGLVREVLRTQTAIIASQQARAMILA